MYLLVQWVNNFTNQYLSWSIQFSIASLNGVLSQYRIGIWKLIFVEGETRKSGEKTLEAQERTNKQTLLICDTEHGGAQIQVALVRGESPLCHLCFYTEDCTEKTSFILIKPL